MGIFDSLFSTTDMGPGGWETTTTPTAPDWLKAGVKSGLGSAFQSPFFGGSANSKTSSSAPQTPQAATSQINTDAIMAALNKLPTSPAAAGKGSGRGIIYGPFKPEGSA